LPKEEATPPRTSNRSWPISPRPLPSPISGQAMREPMKTRDNPTVEILWSLFGEGFAEVGVEDVAGEQVAVDEDVQTASHGSPRRPWDVQRAQVGLGPQ